MDLCRRLIDAAARVRRRRRQVPVLDQGFADLARRVCSQHSGTGRTATPRRSSRRSSATSSPRSGTERSPPTAGSVAWSASRAASRAGEVDLLESLDVPAHKFASMDVNHLPLLEHVARTESPSSCRPGWRRLGEVERALSVLRMRRAGAGRAAALRVDLPLRAGGGEPAAARDVAAGIRRAGGYSDHTMGVAVPLAAVALGPASREALHARHGLEGWDHAISADPAELRALVAGGREVSGALGSGVRTVSQAELDKRKVFRRRMVTTRALRRGSA